MKSLVRWIIGIVVASAITFCLFVLMHTLINSKFKLEEKKEKLSFEINTKIEDVKIVTRETKIVSVRQVVTPPAPPTIAHQAATQPSVAIVSLEGALPVFKVPELDRSSFEIKVSDRDAQPLVRIPPQMPQKAEKSGHCNMRFDVSPEGAPFNINAVMCTSSVFKRASVRNVGRWKYNPKIIDGRAVSMHGVETTIRFKLMDERNRIIPE